MNDDGRFLLYAVCPPGLESILIQELRGLGFFSGTAANPDLMWTIPPKTGAGGVEFHGSIVDMYRTNLHLRCASRVLLRMGSFHASKFVELERKIGNLPWENYVSINHPVEFRVTTHHSRLYHSSAVAEHAAKGITRRLGWQLTIKKYSEDVHAAQLIVIRLINDECTISLDTSGAPLHQRGYRPALAKAPLRETLSAGILLASGWDRCKLLLDPFCGSGAIPIEATLLAMRIPPGLRRPFAFMNWPGFNPTIWSRLLEEADRQVQEPAALILASDRDAGAVQIACENAGRAGVANWIQFSQRAISAIAPPTGPGWVVTNPPYGVRISRRQDLRNLYAQFGNILRARCAGWQVAFLCSDDHLATQTRLHFHEGLSLVNGGIPVKLYRASVQ